MASLTIQQMLDLALQHHRAGRLPEAEQVYRQVLAQQPVNAAAMYYLGLIARQVGRIDIAIEMIRQAVALNPNEPDAHGSLGNLLMGKGQIDDAIAAYRSALSLKPDFPEIYCNLGNALTLKGQLEDAITACRRAIALKPNFAEAYSNLGNALKDDGQLDAAIIEYHRALALAPHLAEIHSNLGNALKDKGLFDEAVAACRRAISQRGDFPEAYNNLGNALQGQGRLSEAAAMFGRAIALRPHYAEPRNNLGNVLRDQGRPDEAVAALRQAILIKPNYAEAYNNLGNVMKDKGQLDDAVAAYRKAVALNPSFADAHSNLAYALYFHPGYDAQAISDEQRCWNQQHTEPLQKFIQAHPNDRDPNRRLRIGYVSPDFRDHVVGRNLLPLFRNHDHRQFEITCYAHVPFPDDITRQLQKHADQWRSIVGLSDEQAARQIREDRIDVLVDLSLHMAKNRLLVFARKPAPVQVTYLAYCGTSGMGEMDYRLSDPHLDPTDTDLSCYSEKTVRLPRTYWCYQPGAPDIDPSPAPVLKNSFITFGCLNNFAKISSAALDLWTRILLAVPNSRIIIHALPGTHVDKVVERMQLGGVEKNRLQFVGNQPWAAYAQTYSQIDIALDPFPYGGGITTCDGLWMGVPVVTLSGQTAVGRGGHSILSNLGLTELIAYTQDQYQRIAIDLSRDISRIKSLREGMRARMLASPLMEPKRFAQDMEQAYRQMWGPPAELAAADQ